MNYTKNRKIAQVKETTLVVGGDIGGQYRYSRALTGEELRPPIVGEVCWI